MSNNYPKMLEAARQYRDKRLCPDCQELQKEVARLRELIAAQNKSAADDAVRDFTAQAINDEAETRPPARQAAAQ